MIEIDERLAKLKRLGAGDSMCEDCLSIKIDPIAVCKKCIENTPDFTEIMNRLCKNVAHLQVGNNQ